MYDGDFIDTTAAVPGIALAGLALGLDALLLTVVSMILVAVLVYRRRGRRRVT